MLLDITRDENTTMQVKSIIRDRFINPVRENGRYEHGYVHLLHQAISNLLHDTNSLGKLIIL